MQPVGVCADLTISLTILTIFLEFAGEFGRYYLQIAVLFITFVWFLEDVLSFGIIPYAFKLFKRNK